MIEELGGLEQVLELEDADEIAILTLEILNAVANKLAPGKRIQLKKSHDIFANKTVEDKFKAAKQAKNFAEADRIRAELSSQGIELIDKPGGTTEWRRC